MYYVNLIVESNANKWHEEIYFGCFNFVASDVVADGVGVPVTGGIDWC